MLFVVSLVSGLVRVKRVAKLMGRNFMRHIALSRESVAQAWLVCQLWHSKSPAFPKFLEKVQRTLFRLDMERFVALVRVETQQLFGPPHSVRTHA